MGIIFTSKPGDNFIATGFWNPEKDDLKRIRKEMELDADEFRTNGTTSFKSVWGTLEGEEVKTAPKGFSKEDPNIDLIRKKALFIHKKYSDKEVLAKKDFFFCKKSIMILKPYVHSSII